MLLELLCESGSFSMESLSDPGEEGGGWIAGTAANRKQPHVRKVACTAHFASGNCNHIGPGSVAPDVLC